MPFPHPSSSTQLAAPSDGSFSYWRPTIGGVIELGIVRGREVALPPHFHDEDQITFVLAGRRRLVAGREPAVLGPGQGVAIPAGVPHHSLSEPYEIVCLNLYAAPGTFCGDDVLRELTRCWRKHRRLVWTEVAGIVDGPTRTSSGRVVRHVTCSTEHGAPWGSVREAAAHAGMSREAFSRRFSKLHGMPPHAFWQLAKLNDARRLLRAGHAIATVAAETGFSDQSHLGRCFRRVFGVTPGRFRVARPASHLF
jgi:AraC-like DNA-binding protein